jgi:ArsR family transcriptional regulator, arsenate/arsenite/antimonite-responsive transcriptional repressor
MGVRERPLECCAEPASVEPLPAAERDAMVAVFRALGEPTRLEVFRLIAAQSTPICVCDVVDRFDVQQPTISHHLKVLREAGLVTVSRRGVWAYYAPSPRGLAVLRQALAALEPAGLVTAG